MKLASVLLKVFSYPLCLIIIVFFQAMAVAAIDTN